MVQSFEIIGVPIDCKGTPGGTELAPDALRDASIGNVRNFVDAGSVPLHIRNSVRDPESGIIGFDDVCFVSSRLRAIVGESLGRETIPLVLGGCCTQLMGCFAGAQDRFKEIGLVYVDGHLDLYTGETSPTGEAADIPLAVLLGNGPQPLLKLLGEQPLVCSKNVFLLGYRDRDSAVNDGSLVPEDFGSALTHYDADRLRADGVAAVGTTVRSSLDRLGIKFWLHLDVDVLDQDVFPATDYLMPGGLTIDEFVALVKPIASSHALVGVTLACYNPEKDPSGRYARAVVSVLDEIFSERGML